MAFEVPEFVSISEMCPDIMIDPVYGTELNFTGSVVPGYKARKILIEKSSAIALCRIQASARLKGHSLKIYDGYRPVKAVKFFVEWAKLPEDNLFLKKHYYPRFSRKELFEKGFIAQRSSHSRGAAVDLTLVDLKNGRELDMGSRFDYFDEISHTESKLISSRQLSNRKLLRQMMEANNFKNYSKEWWHFNYRPEPFPDQYFDFDIE